MAEPTTILMTGEGPVGRFVFCDSNGIVREILTRSGDIPIPQADIPAIDEPCDVAFFGRSSMSYEEEIANLKSEVDRLRAIIAADRPLMPTAEKP